MYIILHIIIFILIENMCKEIKHDTIWKLIGRFYFNEKETLVWNENQVNWRCYRFLSVNPHAQFRFNLRYSSFHSNFMFSKTKNKDRKAQVGEDITFITFINLQHRWFKNLTQKPNILSFWTNNVTNSRLLFFSSHHRT